MEHMHTGDDKSDPDTRVPEMPDLGQLPSKEIERGPGFGDIFPPGTDVGGFVEKQPAPGNAEEKPYPTTPGGETIH